MHKFEIETLLPEDEHDDDEHDEVDVGEASVDSKDPYTKQQRQQKRAHSSTRRSASASSRSVNHLHWTASSTSERIRQTLRSTLSSASLSSSTTSLSSTTHPRGSFSFVRSHRRFRGVSCVILVVFLGVLLHLVTVNQRIPQLVPLYDTTVTDEDLTNTTKTTHHDQDNDSKSSIFPRRPLTVMNANRFKPSNSNGQQPSKKNNDNEQSPSFWNRLFFPTYEPDHSVVTISKNNNNNNSTQPSRPAPPNSVQQENNNNNATIITNTQKSQPTKIILTPPFPNNPQGSASYRHNQNNNKNNAQPLPLAPYHYRLDPPPRTTNTSTHFVQRWCDLSTHGGKSIDWYPDSWQRRAPAFLIPGAKNSGVTALAHLLAQHPQIVPPLYSKVQFFLPHHFRRFVHPTTQVTKVHAARQRLYAHRFLPTQQLQADPNLITFDATGSYLLYSAVTPRRIFCVAPWIKLILVLQDPIDRMVQHYHAAARKGLRVSFQDWVEKDFALLSSVGFMNQTRAFHGSPQEDMAWYDYTTSTRNEGVVGRSMYEIQLRQWLQAVVAIGKQPKKTVLMVRAKKFVQDAPGFMRTIYDFVGVNASASALDEKSLAAANEWLTVNQTYARSIMTKEYRAKLEGFFEIYMKRLPNVLTHYGLAWAQPTTNVDG